MRGHARKAHEWNADTVKADYALVGINITDKEAKEIYSTIDDFSGAVFSKMRKTFKKSQEGKSLDSLENLKPGSF